MEPADAKVRYVVLAKVKSMFLMDGSWFVHFDGSHESICLGRERPNFNPGNIVKITFERTTNAKS
jgi:hypothetical protein